jgi:hypothetical protein
MKKAGGRCHTISQSLDVQRELMAPHGADVVFEEKLSGKDADNRPELQKAFKHGGFCDANIQWKTSGWVLSE